MNLEYMIDLAKRTWGDEVSGSWEHIGAGLCGETGELIDTWKKGQFKGLEDYNIRMVDELGDFWYYLRMAYLLVGPGDMKYEIEQGKEFMESTGVPSITVKPTLYKSCVRLCYQASQFALSSDVNSTVILENAHFTAAKASYEFGILLGHFEWSIEELTLLNWMKLYGGAHGWVDRGEPKALNEIAGELGLDVAQIGHIARTHVLLGRNLEGFT